MRQLELLLRALTLFVLSFDLLAQSSHYEAALERYRGKDYTGAVTAARQALESDAGNPSYLHIYGLSLAAVGQFAESEASLQKAIALAPAAANFHYDLGYVLHQQKKYDQAVPVLKRAVELDGTNLMARFLLGRCYVSSHQSLLIGNFSQLALEQFEGIVRSNPRLPSVHLHIARIHYNNGDDEKALAEFRAELAFHPSNVLARLELGELLLKRGETKKALEQLLAAAREAPNLPLIHYNLAKAHRENAQGAEAIEAARRSVELDPRFADGHYLLGQLYQEMDQPALALKHIEVFQKLRSEGDRVVKN